MMMRTSRLLAPVLLLALAGCFRLSRTAPPIQQYVLGGARSVLAATTAVDTSGFTIGIRRADLAPYLSTPSVVVRHGAHEIVPSRFHRWGEDLGEGINHAVAAHLAVGPPIRAVEVAPWAVRARHDVLVQLHVSRFEGVVDSAATTGRAHALISWDIIRPSNGAILVRGATNVEDGEFTAGDFNALVGQLTNALDRVALDIRGCLGRFAADTLPPPRC